RLPRRERERATESAAATVNARRVGRYLARARPFDRDKDRDLEVRSHRHVGRAKRDHAVVPRAASRHTAPGQETVRPVGVAPEVPRKQPHRAAWPKTVGAVLTRRAAYGPRRGIDINQRAADIA